MATEDEDTGYCDEEEWDSMSNEAKPMFTRTTVQVLPSIQVDNSKSKPIMENKKEVFFIEEEPQEISYQHKENDERASIKSHRSSDNCNHKYINFCLICPMLSNILDNDVRMNISDRIKRTLPKDILVFKRSLEKKKGIFALQSIPAGTTFGPCEGLQFVQGTKGSAWKIERKKFVIDKKADCVNWMALVKTAKHISDNNLKIFQCDHSLYFCSSRPINENEQLLVHYDEMRFKNINSVNTGLYYYPNVETESKNVYACTFCCLGFTLKKYLVNHKKVCPYLTEDSGVLDEIIQCPFCKIYLDEQEYQGFHMTCCCEKHSRKCVMPVTFDEIEDPTLVVKEKKIVDIPKQTNENLTPSLRKSFKCELCPCRYSHKVSLDQHMERHGLGTKMKNKCSKNADKAVRGEIVKKCTEIDKHQSS